MRVVFPKWLLCCLLFVVCAPGVRAEVCPTNDPTCCTVTNPSGNFFENSGNLLWVIRNQIGVGHSQCAKIVLAVDHVDPLTESIFLMPGVQLLGTTTNNVPVTLQLDVNAQAKGCVIDLWHAPGNDAARQGAGQSRLENVKVVAGPGHGVCVHSNNNIIKNVTVTGPGISTTSPYIGVRVTTGDNNLFDTVTVSQLWTGVAIESLASGNRLINLSATQTQFGLEIDGDGFNAVRSGTIADNAAAGVRITGSGNMIGFADGVYGAVTIRNNAACGVEVSSGTGNRITRDSFRNNTGRGICLDNGGNSLFAAPKNLRAIIGGTANEWALAMVVPAATGITEYFKAESGSTFTSDREGETFKGEINTFIAADAAQYLPDLNNNGQRIVFEYVPLTLLKTSDVVVATATNQPANANAASSTSEFSLPAIPGNAAITAPPRTCLPLAWFQKALEIVLEVDAGASTGSVWDIDSDGDGRTNGAEDLDRDCVIDGGETNPGVKDKPIPPTSNVCGLLPAEYCTDTDKDGVMDVQDNCVLIANPDQADTEDPDGDGVFQGDGIGEACEDQDFDGTIDSDDNCIAVANSDQADLDKDGAGDACDPDDDSDGLSDLDEISFIGTDPRNPDSDGDLICDGPGWGYGSQGSKTSCLRPDDNCPRVPNSNQLDSDEDTIGDVCDAKPYIYLGNTDSDGDGRTDQNDRCPYLNDDGTDTDHDGRPDACDNDDDNDGVSDVDESGRVRCIPGKFVVGTTPIVINELFCIALDPKHPDSDHDGLCDGPGPGFDEQCHGGDNCPFHYEAGRGLQLDTKIIVQHVDTDHDGIGDICEDTGSKPDADRDGIVDSKDNCPLHWNPGQRNIDGDAYVLGALLGGDGSIVPISGGDACDPDDDSDLGSKPGTYDWEEGAVLGLHPWEPDSDHYNGRGFDDFCDGAGTGYGTNAVTLCKFSDNCPVLYNPDQKDEDGNGIGDVCDALGIGDRDHDGIPDVSDNCPDTANPDQADQDKDGIGDVCDPDLDGDGVINVVDNCPNVPNPDQTDANFDNIGDACLSFDINQSAPNGTPVFSETVGGIAGFDGGGCSLLR